MTEILSEIVNNLNTIGRNTTPVPDPVLDLVIGVLISDIMGNIGAREPQRRIPPNIVFRPPPSFMR